MSAPIYIVEIYWQGKILSEPFQNYDIAEEYVTDCINAVIMGGKGGKIMNFNNGAIIYRRNWPYEEDFPKEST